MYGLRAQAWHPHDGGRPCRRCEASSIPVGRLCSDPFLRDSSLDMAETWSCVTEPQGCRTNAHSTQNTTTVTHKSWKERYQPESPRISMNPVRFGFQNTSPSNARGGRRRTPYPPVKPVAAPQHPRAFGPESRAAVFAGARGLWEQTCPVRSDGPPLTALSRHTRSPPFPVTDQERHKHTQRTVHRNVLIFSEKKSVLHG